MKASGASALLGAGMVLTTAGCGPSAPTLPEPPMAAETARLVASYEMPTAILDGSNIQQAFTDAQARLDDLHLGWLPDLVVDLLGRVKARLNAAGLPDAPQKFTVNGAPINAGLRVHHICSGWQVPAGPPDEATNGALEAFAVVKDGSLTADLWATATHCQAAASVGDDRGAAKIDPSASLKAMLDGNLSFLLLGRLPTSTTDADLLVVFDGTLAVGDRTGSAAFNFELTPTGVRYQVDAGGGVATVTVGTTIQLAGANATFSCDVATASCQQTK